MHTAEPTPAPSTTPKCPIDHTKQDPNNPLNQIPANLSLRRQPNQTVDLPTERTISSIPRPQNEEDDGKTWDYPSPQQFYNALVRKGWETPEDSVEMMVDIHNFLNERAWREVMRWEAKMPGYASRYQCCKRCADDIVETEHSWLDSKVDQERFRPKLKCIYGQERSSLPNTSKLLLFYKAKKLI
jgi:hypothetical protein